MLKDVTKEDYLVVYWRGKTWMLPAGEKKFNSLEDAEKSVNKLKEDVRVTDIELWKLEKRESTWREH